jgi:hypothetical protein
MLRKRLSGKVKVPARARALLQVDEDFGRVMHRGDHGVPFLAPRHTHEVWYGIRDIHANLQQVLQT